MEVCGRFAMHNNGLLLVDVASLQAPNLQVTAVLFLCMAIPSPHSASTAAKPGGDQAGSAHLGILHMTISAVCSWLRALLETGL